MMLWPLFWILFATSHGGHHAGMWWVFLMPFWIVFMVHRMHSRRHHAPATTVPAMPQTLPTPQRGEFRVSDADRDRAGVFLREHLMAGRITSDEFDDRIASTLRAKTWDDLRAVTRDLPPQP